MIPYSTFPDFCKPYFEISTLKFAMQYGNQPDLGIGWSGDMKNYEPNQGVSLSLSHPHTLFFRLLR